MKDLQAELKKVYCRYHQLKKDPNSWDTWIGHFIEAQVVATRNTKKALWKLQTRQKTAMQVKFEIGKLTLHWPLAIVQEPGEQEMHWECTTKQTLEQACLAEAGCQFTQANQTPCFQSPLWELFVELGICQQAFDEILAGTFTLPNTCNSYTAKLLLHCSHPLGVSNMHPPSLEEYIYGWQHAKETTLSSYLSVHFGCYMAGMYSPTIAIFNMMIIYKSENTLE